MVAGVRQVLLGNNHAPVLVGLKIWRTSEDQPSSLGFHRSERQPRRRALRQALKQFLRNQFEVTSNRYQVKAHAILVGIHGVANLTWDGQTTLVIENVIVAIRDDHAANPCPSRARFADKLK